MDEKEKAEFLAILESLPAENREVLLRTLRDLPADQALTYWSPAIGTVSDSDAAEMTAAIADAFENVQTDA